MNRRLRRELLERLALDAQQICSHFGVRYRSIEAERTNVTRRYGICYDDGTIKIRLGHVVSGEPLKYSSLISTLCHELAHLRHFNHGPEFKLLSQRMLAWARKQEIYQPAPRRLLAPVAPANFPNPPTPPPPTQRRPVELGPRQLELFG